MDNIAPPLYPYTGNTGYSASQILERESAKREQIGLKLKKEALS
jgi:hypothetical protein